MKDTKKEVQETRDNVVKLLSEKGEMLTSELLDAMNIKEPSQRTKIGNRIKLMWELGMLSRRMIKNQACWKLNITTN